jgi:hypothetical protein
MTEFVRERGAQQRPVRYAELLDSLQFHHEIGLSGDSLRQIVRSMPLINVCDAEIRRLDEGAATVMR